VHQRIPANYAKEHCRRDAFLIKLAALSSETSISAGEILVTRLDFTPGTVRKEFQGVLFGALIY
jgi:hypothetical protein